MAEGLTERHKSAADSSATLPGGDDPGREPLRIALFQADVTPPLGSPLCEALVKPARRIVDPLSARGVILLTREKPIVLCAIDWTSILNGGYRVWREVLAQAAGTTP
ncbi:MAG: hypothetical protein KA354_09635, partial [Phycisphaerae bacterium]|nr:hypothetical protein [Phycisphaerae bacterium]